MYERFTDRARKVMQLANQEAQRLNHEYIGTEHILVGLVKEGSGVAANVLVGLDVSLKAIRLEIEKVVRTGLGGDQVISGKLPHTPRAKSVIGSAVEEARSLNHNYVGTEHLLLGLLRESDGAASRVLTTLGLTADTVRAEIMRLLGHTDAAPFRPGELAYEAQVVAVHARIGAAYLAFAEAVEAGQKELGSLAARKRATESSADGILNVPVAGPPGTPDVRVPVRAEDVWRDAMVPGSTILRHAWTHADVEFQVPDPDKPVLGASRSSAAPPTS